MQNMQLYSKQDIQSVFTMADAIHACREAFSLYTQGMSDVPLRTHMHVPPNAKTTDSFGGISLFMPAYVGGIHALGVKVASVFADNLSKNLPTINSQMLVMDADTGIIKCALDGTYLTQLRTGAMTGVATDLLAKKDARIMTLIGTGGQAMAQLDAIMSVRQLTKIFVCSRKQSSREAFIEQVRIRYPTVIFESHSNPDDVVVQSDIITTVTNSPTPTFDGSLLHAGTHVNGVGSFTPQMQEIDLNTLKKANVFYSDTLHGITSEAGDFMIPFNNEELTREQLTGEIGQLLLGQTKGRESDTDITVFKSVGSAVFDVVTAHRIMERLAE